MKHIYNDVPELMVPRTRSDARQAAEWAPSRREEAFIAVQNLRTDRDIPGCW